MVGQGVYRITVAGVLGTHWSSWLGNMRITHRQSATGECLTDIEGVVADQAALRGLMCRVWDLHLRVVSVLEISSGGEHHA